MEIEYGKRKIDEEYSGTSLFGRFIGSFRSTESLSYSP